MSYPKDNIERAIDKSSITADSNFENIRYEGFGPAKTAIIVNTLTDNKNRTASNLRTIFQKHGGHLMRMLLLRRSLEVLRGQIIFGLGPQSPMMLS